jgi:hypothetical protein
MPVAVALYGPLPKQLKRPDSFASQLARMLKVRSQLRLYAAELVDVPAVQSKGLFVLVHRLPDNGDLEVTAINFGSAPLEEAVTIRGSAHNTEAVDVLESSSKTAPLSIDASGNLRLSLKGFEGKAFRIKKE